MLDPRCAFLKLLYGQGWKCWNPQKYWIYRNIDRNISISIPVRMKETTETDFKIWKFLYGTLRNDKTINNAQIELFFLISIFNEVSVIG